MLKPPPSAGIAIPDRDHVLRYLKPTQVKDSVVNGDGFLTRPGENAPSVNWLEWFDPPLDNQISGVRSAARLKYSKNGHLARLNVGETARYVKENGPNGLIFTFEHDPREAEGKYPPDPSHSLIKGIPVLDTPEAELVKDLIAHCVIPPLTPAVPLPKPAKES